MQKTALLCAFLAFFGCQNELPPNSNVAEMWLPSGKNVGDVLMLSLPTPPEADLIGGKPADPKEFPATVYSAQGNSRCTATIVGERVLLIAAHCVGNGRSAVFKASGVEYRSTCTHGPDYARNSTADWALCLIDQSVVNVPFEHVNQEADRLKVGDKLLLTGFGCTSPGGGGGNDGTYRIGESTIRELPDGRSDNDIVTSGGAALCFGDSGGPAFKVDGTQRWQVSVNSRGDIRTTSYLSALHTPQAKKFISSWSDAKKVKICGVHADATGCRGQAPGPKPMPLPASCKVDLDKFNACLYGSPRLALTEPQACQAAHKALAQCEEIAEKIDAGP